MMSVDIICESDGELVCVKGTGFLYKRLGEETQLSFHNSFNIDKITLIKEVIQLYEELISLN